MTSKEIKQSLQNPSTHYWLLNAIRAVDSMDALDAARDTNILALYAKRRLETNTQPKQYTSAMYEAARDIGCSCRVLEAAPKLLEALKAIQQNLVNMAEELELDNTNNGRLNASIAISATAISKAEGR